MDRVAVGPRFVDLETTAEDFHVRTPRAAALGVWGLALTGGVVISWLMRLRARPDIDLWLHLRIGDLLRSGFTFGANPDPLVTLADRPYVPSQWLGQEVFSWLYQYFGLTGILALRLLLIEALVAFLYLACRNVVGPMPAAASTLLATIATAAAWGERPQLIGLVLEAAVSFAWLAARIRGRAYWVVIPTMWLWACVHGSWVVGLATGILGAVAIMLERPKPHRLGRLMVVNVLSVAAVAATPLGPSLLSQPFAVNEIARDTVNEWQSPRLSNPLYVLVLVMAAIVVVRAVRRWRSTLPDLLTAAAAAALAAYSVRTVAFAAVLVAPAFASAMATRRDKAPQPLTRAELRPWLAAALVLAVLPGAIVGVDRQGPLGPATSSELRNLPAGSHVAVDVRVSGWVLHEFPSVRPLRDLRVEVYSPAAAARFEDLITARPGWPEIARQEKVAAVLADSSGPLAQQLKKRADWSQIADEKGYALWVPTMLPDR